MKKAITLEEAGHRENYKLFIMMDHAFVCDGCGVGGVCFKDAEWCPRCGRGIIKRPIQEKSDKDKFH